MSKNVVIIGGGFGGVSVARKIDGKANITLIDGNVASHDNIVSLRGVFDETLRWQMLVPHPVLKTGKFVHGRVASVKKDSVELEDGTSIPYDILVLSPGSKNNQPAKFMHLSTGTEALEEHAKVYEAVKASSNILIAGGGPVGIELAGEIHHYFPDKNITIVHRGKTLLSNQGGGPQLSEKLQTALGSALAAQNIKVHLATELKDVSQVSDWAAGNRTFQSTSGASFETDLFFNCTGASPNTAFLKSFLGSSMEENGQIKVEPNLSVQAMPNVFALGDVTNIRESKLAYVAGDVHGPIVAKNVISLIKGKQANAIHKPAAAPSMFLVLGPKVGIAELGIGPKFMHGVYTKGMLSKAKNGGNLFIEKRWNTSGYKLPKKIEQSPVFKK